MLDRAQGSMVGLALGDALGTTLEFKTKDSYQSITDMNGGGPFSLNAGEWTDDTSMMLCLAESLLATGKHDPKDQIQRYLSWWKEGHNSVNGQCFDIGNTVSDALTKFQFDNDANAGSSDEYSAGNGSLMRLAPIPIFYSSYRHVSEQNVIKIAGESSLTTHAEQRTIESCQIMAWLLYQIYNSNHCVSDKTDLFNRLSTHWSSCDIHPNLKKVIQGSFLTKTRAQIRGSGFVVHSLEAALWAFANSTDFRDGALLAANLGEDADTTAAIYGQLAGAYYGYSQLPTDWLSKLAWHDKIKEYATLLVNAPKQEDLSSFEDKVITQPKDSCNRLIYQALYDHNFILQDYPWMDYPNRHLLTSSNYQQPQYNGDQRKALIESLTFIQCFQLITTVIRADRFNEGIWRRFQEDGSLKLWLKQLHLFIENQ
ncbi:ADP-ribosylglycohydrolase family protein [Shewanella sp. 4_MG-2023]|uniref:ADP-ribosylglycohydrolase family protein n=1 Tax=Shewanella sp. 4_MG-2023 TaxID=3062652 RepID=UPI0026E3966A|nr:ADP-ribosylglycohydrolase family protein [Shewanella sp. 4_MG-2023]MDO6678436.1 ADP-ribosylglycohydrolase family protein [Shewanella sp. 4_MG-2023]